MCICMSMYMRKYTYIDIYIYIDKNMSRYMYIGSTCVCNICVHMYIPMYVHLCA